MYNIKTDFGAKGDGVTDDYPAFLAFRTAAAGLDVTLLIPPGVYILSGAGNMTSGITRCTIYGYGATVKQATVGTNAFYTDNLHSARIDTTVADANTVTLKTAGDAAIFSLFDWVYIGGLDLQGFGYPPNHQFFEFNLITGISGSTITLYRRLRYIYRDTWPLYSAGDASNVDLGGPATIYKMQTGWACENTIYGLTFYNTGQQYLFGQIVELIDCNLDNVDSYAPAGNQRCYHRLTSCGPEIEIDKAIDEVRFDNCQLRNLNIQSASCDRLVIDGCEIGLAMTGSAKNTIIKNSYVRDLKIAPRYYGVMDSCLLENSRIGTLDFTYEIDQQLSAFTATDGTLSKVTSSPIAWAVPGASLWLGDGQSFKVVDVRKSGGTTLIDTTLPDPVVEPAPEAAGSSHINVHNEHQLKVVNCTGAENVVNLSQPSAGLILTYLKRTYLGPSSSASTPTGFIIDGQLVKVRINVRRAYSGASGTLTFSTDSANHSVIVAGNTISTFVFQVNAKTTGERILPATGVATGTVAGDTFPAIGPFWFRYSTWTPILSADISAEAIDLWPIIELQVETDLGVYVTNSWGYGTKFIG